MEVVSSRSDCVRLKMRSDSMPVIKVEISKQTKESKKEIIENLTKTMAEVTKIPAQAFTVLINEYDTDSIGVGGVQLSERK